MRRTPFVHRAAHATWWSAVEVSTRYGVQFGVMVVLARLLPPESFGLVAMMLVFTSVGAIFVDSGFSTALIQKREATQDDETTAFVFGLAASVLVAVLLVLAAPAIARFYDQPELVALIAVFVATLPLAALASVPDAVLTKRLEFRARAQSEAIASILSGALAVFLAWRGHGVWSLVWQSLASISLRALLLWHWSGWRPRGRFRTDAFRGLFRFGGFMLLNNLLDVASIRLQSLLIGRLFDTQQLGYYTLAQNTQQAPTSFIGGILNRVGLPVFASLTHEPTHLRDALRLSLRVSMFLFAPVMIGIAMAAAPLIELVYGARWLPAAPVLAILCLSAAFWPLHVLNLAAISAQGSSDLVFRLALVKKGVLIALVVACARSGPVAIAWAVFVAGTFALVVNTHYARTRLHYGILAQIRDLASTVVLTAVAAGVGWSILHFNPPSLLATFASIAVAAVVYLGLALVFRVVALVELGQMLGALARGRTPPPDEPAIPAP